MLGRTLLLVAVLQVTVFALPSTTQARIGETRADCELRYGKGRDLEMTVGEGLEEASKSWSASVYSARGLTIEVVYENDRAVFIRYANQPVLSLGSHARQGHNLTQKEIEYLRSVNATRGAKWRRYQNQELREYAPNVTVWKTPDSLYFSGYDREAKRLFVCNSLFWDTVINQIQGALESSDGSDSGFRLQGL